MSANHSIKIVTKLNRETKEGKIIWNKYLSSPPSLTGSEVLVGNAYRASVLNKYIVIYMYQSKSYYDEDQFEWVKNCRLEFIDVFGQSEWTFPDDASIMDLYESVRYQITGIDKFITDYIDKEDKDEIK